MKRGYGNIGICRSLLVTGHGGGFGVGRAGDDRAGRRAVRKEVDTVEEFSTVSTEAEAPTKRERVLAAARK